MRHHNFRIFQLHSLEFTLGGLSIRYHIYLKLLETASVREHHLVLCLSLLNFVSLATQSKAINHGNYISFMVSHSHEGTPQTLAVLLVLYPLSELFSSNHDFNEVCKLHWLCVDNDALRLRRQPLGFFALWTIITIRIYHNRALLRFSFTFPESLPPVILVGTFLPTAMTAVTLVGVEGGAFALSL